MNLSQLRYVKAVAETGSFTRAAERCYVTQPTLSNGIAQLEQEWEERLFTRTTRRVSFTPFGQHLLPCIDKVLEAQVELLHETRNFVRPSRQVIRIGTSPLMRAGWLVRMLEEFRKAHTDIDIILHEQNMADLYPQLRATVIDLPTVTPITQRFIEEGDMAGRVEAISGDVVHGPLTGTYDVAVLRSFIQVLSRDNAQRALHNISSILEPGSPIYILGQVLDDSRLSPLESVVSNIFLINIYDKGQAYTYGEHRDWLMRAGFTDIDRVIQTGGYGLIAAHKPS